MGSGAAADAAASIRLPASCVAAPARKESTRESMIKEDSSLVVGDSYCVLTVWQCCCRKVSACMHGAAAATPYAEACLSERDTFRGAYITFTFTYHKDAPGAEATYAPGFMTAGIPATFRPGLQAAVNAHLRWQL
jgi:hypothetical protein